MAWWNKKQPEPEAPHVETVAEYWQKRDAARDAHKAAEKAQAEDTSADDWTGYSAPSVDDDANLFGYELSAYSDTVGYHADGIQRVSKVRR